jgi:hypothetical protein
MATVDGAPRQIALRITASAIEASYREHAEPNAAAGALLTDAEEGLHFAVESDGVIRVIIS